MKTPASSKPAVRRFTLLDGMILVGMVALGLAATRWSSAGADWWLTFQETTSQFAWNAFFWGLAIQRFLIFEIPWAVSLTLGVLALRLRKPRPRWRRLVRQPGLMACLALALSWGIAGAYACFHVFESRAVIPYASRLGECFSTFIFPGSVLGGFAVVMAWATQLLCGHWRAEPSWLDRLGRLIGVGWIGMAILATYVLGNFL